MHYSLSLNNQDLVPYEIKAPIEKLGYLRASVARVNIQLGGATELPPRLVETIEELQRRGYDYTCCCSNLQMLKTLLAMGIHAYISWPITDWETFNALVKLGVSDILIDGPLCFQNKALHSVYTVMIRAIPNYTTTSILEAMSPSSFFIRPEDVELYNDSIDVLEFKTVDQVQEEALHKIYTRGSYLLDINTLIPEMDFSVPNPLIDSKEFTERRLNCGQRCRNPDKLVYKCDGCNLYIKWLNTAEKYLKTEAKADN